MTAGRTVRSASRPLALTTVEVAGAVADADVQATEVISADELQRLVESRIHRAQVGHEAELNLPSEITGLLDRPKAQLVAAPPQSPMRRRQGGFSGAPASPSRQPRRQTSSAYFAPNLAGEAVGQSRRQAATSFARDDSRVDVPTKGERFAAGAQGRLPHAARADGAGYVRRGSGSVGGAPSAPVSALDDSTIEAPHRRSGSALLGPLPKRDERVSRASADARVALAASTPAAVGQAAEVERQSGNTSGLFGRLRAALGCALGPAVLAEDGVAHGDDSGAIDERHAALRPSMVSDRAQAAMATMLGTRSAAADADGTDGLGADGFAVAKWVPSLDSLVLHPNSAPRKRWDALIFVAALVVTCEAPFAAAFLEATPPAIVGISLLVDVLILTDVFVKCLTGFVSDDANSLEMNVRQIVRHYAQSAMLPDVLAALPWRLIGLAVHGGRLRSADFQTFVRIARLTRCLKIFVVLVTLRKRSPTVKSLVTVVGLAYLIAMHWFTCLQWALPRVMGYPADSWVILTGMLETDMSTRYVQTAFNTVCQMACIGYGNYQPTTRQELITTMFNVVIGSALFGMMVSALSVMLASTDYCTRAFAERLEAINQYLSVTAMPVELRKRVRAHLQADFPTAKLFDESQVFAMLPYPLQRDLRLVRARTLYQKVPLFRAAGMTFMMQIAQHLTPYNALPGEYLVHEGEKLTRVVFIDEGVVHVLAGRAMKLVAELSGGAFIGEVSAIRDSFAVATVRVVEDAALFSISAHNFRELLKSFPEVRHAIMRIINLRLDALEQMAEEARAGSGAGGGGGAGGGDGGAGGSARRPPPPPADEPPQSSATDGGAAGGAPHDHLELAPGAAHSGSGEGACGAVGSCERGGARHAQNGAGANGPPASADEASLPHSNSISSSKADRRDLGADDSADFALLEAIASLEPAELVRPKPKPPPAPIPERSSPVRELVAAEGEDDVRELRDSKGETTAGKGASFPGSQLLKGVLKHEEPSPPSPSLENLIGIPNNGASPRWPAVPAERSDASEAPPPVRQSSQQSPPPK